MLDHNSLVSSKGVSGDLFSQTSVASCFSTSTFSKKGTHSRHFLGNLCRFKWDAEADFWWKGYFLKLFSSLWCGNINNLHSQIIIIRGGCIEAKSHSRFLPLNSPNHSIEWWQLLERLFASHSLHDSTVALNKCWSNYMLRFDDFATLVIVNSVPYILNAIPNGCC